MVQFPIQKKRPKISLLRKYSVVCGIAESVVILFISNLDMGRQADYGNDFNAPRSGWRLARPKRKKTEIQT